MTGFHHDPLSVPADSRSLVAIVAIADRLACERAQGFRLDVRDTAIPPEFLDAARLSRQAFDEISHRLGEEIETVGSMLAAA